MEGKEADGKDSIAMQLAEQTHWKDLVIIIAVVTTSFQVYIVVLRAHLFED